jgi:peptidoglycan/LPS O-acetylase OafA/YrhL
MRVRAPAIRSPWSMATGTAEWSLPASRGTGEIRALTSLRGFAAMMVVMQHFSSTAQQHSQTTIPSLVPHGYMAVDLFFVLSGFIMSYTYLEDFVAGGLSAFSPFLLKRVARIVPLNIFAVLLIFVLGACSIAVLGRNIIHDSTNPVYDGLCNLLMLQGLGIGLNINGPSWSISTEFAAYLVFPLLIGLIFNRRPGVAVGTVVCCMLALAGMTLKHPRYSLVVDTVTEGVIKCLSEFLLGLATYRVFQSPRARAILAMDLVAVGALGWTLLMLAMRVDFLVLCGLPPLVGALAANRSSVAAWLGMRVPYFLGVISFSVYMLHDPMRPIWLEVIRFSHPDPMSTPLALVVAFFCSLSVIPVAWLAYVAIERPGRRIIRRLSSVRVR